jgi:hypothetical protein
MAAHSSNTVLLIAPNTTTTTTTTTTGPKGVVPLLSEMLFLAQASAYLLSQIANGQNSVSSRKIIEQEHYFSSSS